MVKYYWDIRDTDQDKVAVLQRELNTTRKSICEIFVQRGFENFDQVKEFIHPSLGQLHDPFLMKDMEKAASRIIQAITNNEKILIYGDYDVDGTSSVALLYRYLSKVYKKQYFDFYVPNRYSEGYGISQKGVEFAIQNKFSLLISVDCGITSADLIRYAATQGIHTIICDHHLPGDTLPMAFAILNPKQPDCEYPFKELCGGGVTYKLISALNLKLAHPESYCHDLLDLAALATGADIVPLTGENRIIAWHGLKKLNEKPNQGIKSLKDIFEKNHHYDNERVVFYLAPRINAAGRMAHGKLAVNLLIADDLKIADSLAEELHNLNEVRKEKLKSATEQALSDLESKPSLKARNTTVLYHKDWHPGVIGIVASKLIEYYFRPTIILTNGEQNISGSARSINGFNIHDALSDCSEYLLKFGGHQAAAGVTLRLQDLEKFSDKFEESVSGKILPEERIQKILIDSIIPFEEIDFKLFNSLKRMEPFGPGNPKPIFMTKNVKLTGPPRILNEKHIKFSFAVNDDFLAGIGFNLANRLKHISYDAPLDFVYTIEQNYWNNQISLQINILDFRNSF